MPSSTPRPKAAAPPHTFSHIQIAAREPETKPPSKRSNYIPEDWQDEIESLWDDPEDSAVFRTPSYQATAATEIGSSTARSATTNDTPIKGQAHTSFADMARVGASFSGQDGSESHFGSPEVASSSSNVVKLRPSGRVRGSKAWKPLDLSTIDGKNTN